MQVRYKVISAAMNMCLPQHNYIYILGKCRESKSDECYLHLTDVGLLLHMLETHTTPTLARAVYTQVDMINAAPVLVDACCMSSASRADEVLLRPPGKRPRTAEEEDDRVLKEHWQLMRGQI